MKSMTGSLKHTLVALLRQAGLPALGVAALIGLVFAVNPASLGRAFQHANPRLLLLMVPVTVTIYVFRGLAWWVTLRRTGVPVSWTRAVWAIFAAKPLVFIPFGDLGRVAVLEATGLEGHDAGELTGTVAFQELSYLTLMGLAIVPGLVRFPRLAGVVAALLLLQFSIFLVLFWKPAYARAVSLVEHVGVLRRFDCELRHIRTSFIHLWDAPTVAATVVLNGVSVVLSFVLFLLALNAVGATHVSFAQASLAYALGHILSGFSFLPGSLGAYEGLLTFFLSIQGVSPASAAAAALLFRGFNDVVMAMVGMAFLYPLRRRSSHGRPLGERLRSMATRVA